MIWSIWSLKTKTTYAFALAHAVSEKYVGKACCLINQSELVIIKTIRKGLPWSIYDLSFSDFRISKSELEFQKMIVSTKNVTRDLVDSERSQDDKTTRPITVKFWHKSRLVCHLVDLVWLICHFTWFDLWWPQCYLTLSLTY